MWWKVIFRWPFSLFYQHFSDFFDHWWARLNEVKVEFPLTFSKGSFLWELIMILLLSLDFQLKMLFLVLTLGNNWNWEVNADTVLASFPWKQSFCQKKLYLIFISWVSLLWVWELRRVHTWIQIDVCEDALKQV